MAETFPSPNPDRHALQARLRDVAMRLRQPGPINPESKHALAALVDDLVTMLEAKPAPPTEVTQLAESTAHLAESLHREPDKGLLGSARDRLENAVSSAEAHAPVTVGLARRLLDALANLGI